MSEVTPDHVMYAIWQNSHGIGSGPVVTLSEWRTYYTDLDGWFTYWGELIDMSLKTVGGGIYRIEGTKRGN